MSLQITHHCSHTRCGVHPRRLHPAYHLQGPCQNSAKNYETDGWIFRWVHIQEAKNWTVRAQKIYQCATFDGVQIECKEAYCSFASIGSCGQPDVYHLGIEGHLANRNRGVCIGQRVTPDRQACSRIHPYFSIRGFSWQAVSGEGGSCGCKE